nr:hypothetical protein [Tanacetum cinerariifolium]
MPCAFYSQHSVPASGVRASSLPASIVSTSGVPADSVPASGVLAGSLPASGVPVGSLPASGVPAGSVPASGVPAGSLPASRVPAGGVLAGSIDSTEFGVPAANESVPAVFTNDPTDTSLLPPSHSLGSCEHTTRFPSPSDLGNHQPTADIFSSSSYDDDLCADSPVRTRGTVQKSKFSESTFISYVYNHNRTNHADHLHCLFAYFLSQLEPSSVGKALEDPDWVAAMQEEMQQFYHQQVWKLVPLPAEKIAIGTKLILKNKRDTRGIVDRSHLTFPSICLIHGLYGLSNGCQKCLPLWEIKEEVYVTQPKGFEDPHNPKHVYRVVKAFYGLYQVPRTWYYRRGTINKTLFLKKDTRQIILVQVYMDDIIFGSTNKAWCDEFKVLMKGEFEMSAMGEFKFFLGLQVKQLPYGIFISQDKYVKDMLNMFDMDSVRTKTTPYEVPKHKSKGDPDDAVNVYLFRSMIGSLMYLTASRPNIMFPMSDCSRHQLDAYSDSDYVGSHGDRKSTTGGCQFLGRRLISWQCTKQTVVATSSTEAKFIVAASCCGQVSNAAGCTCIPTGSYSFILWTWFLLLLIHAVDLVPAGSCIIPIGRYSIMLWTWFLLVLNHAGDLILAGSCTTPTVRLVPTGRYVIPAAYVCIPHLLCFSSLSRLHKYLSMAALQYKDDHNKVAYLEKGKGWEAYAQILDFLQRSHIRYALTHRPRIVFDSLVKQFWATTTVHNHEAGPSQTITNIDGNQDGPHMLLLAPTLVVPAAGDGADAVAAGAAATHDVLPPSVPPIHSSSYIPGPSSAPQSSPMREPTPVREPTPRPIREPTPDSLKPPSLPPRSEEVGPTTSTRPPSLTRQSSFHADISEGGGDFVSSPKSNEAPQTPTATTAGGAADSAALTALSLKLDRCINRVTSLDNELGITKQVLGDAVLNKSLGGDSTDKATSHDAAEVPAYATMPFRRRRMRKPFSSFPSAHVPENILAGTGILAAATIIPAGSSMDAVVTATERILKNLYDYHLGEDLAKKLHAEQEAEFARQQEELAQKAHADRVASPTEHGPGLSDQHRRELDAAQLIYTEADWLELLAKIATNSALSKQLLGDDVTEDNMNERLGMLLLRKRRELAAQSWVLASVPAASSFAVDVSVSAATPPEVPAAESRLADTPTASVHVYVEPSVAVDSGSDDDPLRYAPYAGWKIVLSPLGSVHAYSDMAGHTKQFTFLRELLHMAKRTDLQKLMGTVDNLYQREDPDSFALLLIDDAFAAGVYILVLSYFRAYAKTWIGGVSCWFLTTQQMVFSSTWLTAEKELTHHEGTALSWLVQEQTALGKDESNSLTVGSLLKTTWSLIHHLLTNEVLTSPEQTATDQMLLFHDPVVFGVPAGLSCWSPYSCWCLVAAVWYVVPASRCKLLAVGSLFFWQWEQPSLAVGTYTTSRNFLLAVGMPCAFYSQQSSPKLDAPFALKFSRIKWSSGEDAFNQSASLENWQYSTPPPTSKKAVKEICVTCGGAHPYYQCLATDGNTFLELQDNIQGYVSAAVSNYNQGNSGYRSLGVANHIRPSGFAQPNVQNNQNRFSQPQGYNRGNNFNKDSSYQAPMQQNQVVPLSEVEKIKKMNKINMKAMQTKINNVKNKLRNEMKKSIKASMPKQTNELKNIMASFFQMNTTSTSSSGPLPSNTIANSKGELKAITT